MVGFALSGAFLSVAYYPHVFVLSGLMISARCVAGAERGAGVSRARRPGEVRWAEDALTPSLDQPS